MASIAVRIERDHADSRIVRTVFAHKTVGVRPVWEVFGHQGSGDFDPLYVVDGALNLKEGTGQEDEERKL